MAKRSMRMTIKSILAEGKDAKERILAAVKQAGFNPHCLFAINLALEEAIINAIKHGNHLDPRKKVRVQAEVTPRQAVIVIEDEGPGFDRQHVPDPRVMENLEKCSGRGIFLIESYMDKAQWTHGGRRLRMVKKNKLDTSCTP